MTDLAARQFKIDIAPEPVTESATQWGNFRRIPKAQLVAVLQQMASGLQRCMYCEDSAGTDVEHFRPKSKFPERTFDWENHLLACSYCNSNQKRNKFPVENGIEMLINPVDEDPALHLVLSPSTGRYKGSTTRGKRTIDVFGLNRQTCREGRKLAWIACELHFCAYALAMSHKGSSLPLSPHALLQMVRSSQFQSVREEFVRACRNPVAIRNGIVSAAAAKALGRYPELAD